MNKNDFDRIVEEALREWAEREGGEQLQRFGRSALGRIHPGAANDDTEPATGIERHVRRMEALGRWKEARVLRVEYMMPGAPEAERINALVRLGLEISRASYYVYLASARTFIAGALSANDDPDNPSAEIA